MKSRYRLPSPRRLTQIGLLLTICQFVNVVPAGVLRPSDVVFMYGAEPSTYAEYGATVLAWGDKPTSNSLAAARGVKHFGSVGMVTEFASFHRRVGDRYQEALCRDLEGKPVKVPWLTDHQHEGVPYWWCCTQQPLFREFLRERVVETVKAGADGVHIDDHLGTAGGLWLGICLCDRCVSGFRTHLAALPATERDRLIVGSGEINYRDTLRTWLAGEGKGRKVTDHPLWPEWTVYQCRAAAAFMMELRALAAETAGHPVPIGANAGLLWPRHLVDYRALDLFTAETDHHASSRKPSDLPLVAYRMAEAMSRPYAATASGGDWAFIKEQNLPGLVRCWIALSYAAGQRLMVPNHQWCHTPEKGTHWYDGPAARFAPLYQFVRRQAGWLDGYETWADLAVVMPHRAYIEDPRRWFDLCNRLAATNMAYRILVAGDELVDHPLTQPELAAARALLVPDRERLFPADRAMLDQATNSTRTWTQLDEALRQLTPAVRVRAPGQVRTLPRVKPGSVVVHLLNYDYDAALDDVRPQERIEVLLDLKALGLEASTRTQWITPDDPAPIALVLREGRVEIPRLGLWGMLVISPAGEPAARP